MKALNITSAYVSIKVMALTRYSSILNNFLCKAKIAYPAQSCKNKETVEAIIFIYVLSSDVV